MATYLSRFWLSTLYVYCLLPRLRHGIKPNFRPFLDKYMYKTARVYIRNASAACFQGDPSRCGNNDNKQHTLHCNFTYFPRETQFSHKLQPIAILSQSKNFFVRITWQNGPEFLWLPRLSIFVTVIDISEYSCQALFVYPQGRGVAKYLRRNILGETHR